MVNKKLIFLTVMIIPLISIGLIISIESNNPLNHGHYVSGDIFDHNADEILIEIKGNTMTLQEAIDNNFFLFGNEPSQDYTTNIQTGHTADEIEVLINGVGETFQDAIYYSLSDHGFFCSDIGATLVGGSNINVLINGQTKTLQQILDDKILCGCDLTLWEQSCGGSACVNPGAYDCDGNCVGTSYHSAGSRGGCSVCSQCDGAGSCVALSKGAQPAGCTGCYKCNGAGTCEYVCYDSGYDCSFWGMCDDCWKVGCCGKYYKKCCSNCVPCFLTRTCWVTKYLY